MKGLILVGVVFFSSYGHAIYTDAKKAVIGIGLMKAFCKTKGVTDCSPHIDKLIGEYCKDYINHKLGW